MNAIANTLLVCALIVAFVNAQQPCVSDQFITEWRQFDWTNPHDYVGHSYGISYINYDLLQERTDVRFSMNNITTNVTIIANFAAYTTYTFYPDTKECEMTKNNGVMNHCLPADAVLSRSYQFYGSVSTDEWDFWDQTNTYYVHVNLAQGTNVIGSVDQMAYTEGNLTSYINQQFVNWQDTPVSSDLFELPDYCTSLARPASHESLSLLKKVFSFNFPIRKN